MATRYAVYFSPSPGSALGIFGARIVGVDAETGTDLPPLPLIIEAIPDHRELAQEPARYGFHATLKPPFELAPSVTEVDLVAEVDRLSMTLKPCSIGQLVASVLTRFVALTPIETRAETAALAAAVVQKLDHLRAPLSPQDRSRRDPDRLTERQRGYLDRWGYPFVLDDFRFHMTLTGPVPPDRLASVRQVLETVFQSEVADWQNPVAIDALTIFKQADRQARFRVLSRHALTGTMSS
jgi:putative phosphonate metabolism protein